MAMVEFDETELQALQRNSKLMAGALANPKSRELVLKALKAADPNLPIPELDAKEPINQEISAIRDDFKAMRDEIKADRESRENESRQNKMQAQWNEGRSKVQRQGYVGDALESLEKFMEEKGVADHEIAAAAFEKLHPQTKPVNNGNNKFDFFNRNSDKNSERLNDLWKTGDENAFLGPAIDEVLKQERGQAA